MAIANSILGKIRGSISNLTFYVRKGEQQVIRKKPSERQTSSERQQRQETAFAEAMEQSYTFIDAIEVGFPEGVKGYPAGIQGFVKANVGKACTGERIDPSAKFKRQKKAPRAFRGRTDYALVQVAAGPLEVPRAEAVLDEEAGTVVFRCMPGPPQLLRGGAGAARGGWRACGALSEEEEGDGGVGIRVCDGRGGEGGIRLGVRAGRHDEG